MKKTGFLGRRIQGLKRRWQSIAGSEYDAETAGLRPNLPAEDYPLLLEKMRQCLDTQGGEIRARSRAAALGRTYLNLNLEGRAGFLRMLAAEFDLDPARLSRATLGLKKADDPAARRTARRELLALAESPRTRILTRFNALPEGVKFLVDLRADLLPLARKDPDLGSLDDDLKTLLTAWFDPGFLQLRRISWHTASGALLEKFIAYEAVHPVENWEDLKNRLDHDRRYFAFFHPRMPEEPLIFLEVALVQGLADNIQTLLDPSAPVADPDQADTAIFYSISNAQPGLAGIAFGGFLIKRVVDELAREFPGLKTYATLSPLPGFRSWLEPALPGTGAAGGGEGENSGVLLPSEIKRLRSWTDPAGALDWLRGVIMGELWMEDEGLEKTVKPILLRLAAHYLAEEKKGEGRALDPVAHFHLSNGARIERLNWAADTSERGMAQSAGVMVNYLYDSRTIEENHEAYRSGEEVSASSSVKGMLKG